jgi:hypothetical protein
MYLGLTSGALVRFVQICNESFGSNLSRTKNAKNRLGSKLRQIGIHFSNVCVAATAACSRISFLLCRKIRVRWEKRV